jgi:hypothetical protein
MIATNQGLGTLEQATDRDFFVWVDPTNFSIKHHVALVGSFYGGPAIPSLVDGPEGLPFIANPNEVPQSLSPFHSNVVRDYRVEWNLESLRYREFGHLPSRLQALFLLDTKADALRYSQIHPDHVKGRILKRGRSVGACQYSMHDTAWIDFMRLPHSMDQETIQSVGRAYWRGVKVETCELTTMGKPWHGESCPEVLFYGTLQFPNKALTAD